MSRITQFDNKLCPWTQGRCVTECVACKWDEEKRVFNCIHNQETIQLTRNKEENNGQV